MSQFNVPVRRRGGELNVFTGILCAAFLVLLMGVILMARTNLSHSKLTNLSTGTEPGGIFKLVD